MQIKKSMKNLFLILLLTSFSSYGHQPDISTSVLSKTAEGKYILQITSSLGAFEGEIDYLYSKNSYKSADEFKNLVINHFKKNVFFVVNEKDTLKFGQPLVILGHESKLVVEILNVPTDINTIYYKNTMFKDMPHNQMAVIMLVEALPKEQYILENENNQEINLVLNDKVWESVSNSKSNKITILLLSILILVVVLSIAFFSKKLNKTKFRKTKI